MLLTIAIAILGAMALYAVGASDNIRNSATKAQAFRQSFTKAIEECHQAYRKTAGAEYPKMRRAVMTSDNVNAIAGALGNLMQRHDEEQISSSLAALGTAQKLLQKQADIPDSLRGSLARYGTIISRNALMFGTSDPGGLFKLLPDWFNDYPDEQTLYTELIQGVSPHSKDSVLMPRSNTDNSRASDKSNTDSATHGSKNAPHKSSGPLPKLNADMSSVVPAAPPLQRDAVKLTQGVSVVLPSGQVTLPEGTILRYFGTEGPNVRVSWNNNMFFVPAISTDLTNLSAAPTPPEAQEMASFRATSLSPKLPVNLRPAGKPPDFKAGDEVQITRAATLTFNGKTFRDATIGDRFKVLVYRPAEKRVYLGLRDSGGKDIAVAVDDDAVIVVPLPERAIAAVRLGQLNEAAVLLQAATRADPGNSEFAEMQRVILAPAKASEALAAAKRQSAFAMTEAARLEKNAAVTDRPNPLFPNDTSNHMRAEAMRTQAQRLKDDAETALRNANENYATSMAALRNLNYTSTRAAEAPVRTSPAPAAPPASIAVEGTEIVTTNGTRYSDARVTRVDGDVLTIAHDGGVARVRFTDLPDDVRKKYGVAAIKGAEGVVAKPSTSAVPAPTPVESNATLLSAATKENPFVNSLGMKFVPVPITGGLTDGNRVLFSVWDTRVQDYAVYAAENPGVDMEWKDAQDEAEKQGPTHPVVNVNWDEAKAFCAWLTKKDRMAKMLGPDEEYRLPGDHEWSCAVGIGEREDPKAAPISKNGKIPDVYPWGNAWPPPKGAGNYQGEGEALSVFFQKFEIKGYRDGFRFTSPVGSFNSNRYGLYDMGGNVWQWCEGWYEPMQAHFSRGAAYRAGSRGDLLSSYRIPTPHGMRSAVNGFRVVVVCSSSGR